jgi:hypothetical protein
MYTFQDNVYMKSKAASVSHLKIADEVFIATAVLHKENPDRDGFKIGEIVDRVANLFGDSRPGVRVHASVHCVANRPPDPAPHRMLFELENHRRRLLKSGDAVHPQRKGKIWPDAESVPPEYRDLIEWAKQRFEEGEPPRARWLDGLFQMRGMGRELWKGQDPDEYVRELRENW